MFDVIPRAARAFTLIELLLVVAIIAVLSAIAIPNLLEAQVRAKVSRARADLRSTATALEAYRVDSNRYPPDIQYAPLVASRNLYCFLPRLVPLSTPVAYISSPPEDVFAPPVAASGDSLSVYYRFRPSGEPQVSDPLVRPYTFDYGCRTLPDGRDEDADANGQSTGLWTRRISRVPNAQWAMRSVGPDLIGTVIGQDHPACTSYDPTNGTTSWGDIYYQGPGIGPDFGPIR
ncbi:MAG: type IV pilin protein [Candidatus Sumerlaeaceae bacterium]